MMLFCRLRWYALATSRMLRRHWQALLLSVLLLPAMPVFAQAEILGAPALAALAPSHGVEWRFAWVHMLEAVSMLWVLVQRTAITGGAFANFLESLPTSNGQRRAVDIAVVLSQGVIALIAAATVRDLRAAQLRAEHFMRSLPIAAAAQPRADILTVVALAPPFACIAPLLLVPHGVLPLWSAADLLGAAAPLLALLYLPQRYAPRQSVLPGTMLAMTWVTVVWRVWQLFI